MILLLLFQTEKKIVLSSSIKNKFNNKVHKKITIFFNNYNNNGKRKEILNM